MRKQNSDFEARFISEEGSRLKNRDYFGYVELDEFACYVIADGITEITDIESARLARKERGGGVRDEAHQANYSGLPLLFVHPLRHRLGYKYESSAGLI